MEIKKLNIKGQITGYSFLVGIIAIIIIFMSLIVFHTSIANRYGVEIDSQYLETYGIMNETLNDTQTLSASLETKAQSGADVSNEKVDISAPRAAYEAAVIFLSSPTIAIKLVNAMLSQYGIPVWFIGGIITIILITVVFIVLAYIRGKNL